MGGRDGRIFVVALGICVCVFRKNPTYADKLLWSMLLLAPWLTHLEPEWQRRVTTQESPCGVHPVVASFQVVLRNSVHAKPGVATPQFLIYPSICN